TAGFSDISGALSDSYTFDPSNTDTTYFRVVVGNGVCDADTSLLVRVAIVNEPLAGTVEPSDTTICASGTAILRITGSIGGGTLSYNWQSTTDTTAGFSDISGALSDSYTFGPLNTDTTYFRVVVGNGVCDADTSLVIRVAVVDPPVAGTVSSDTAVCSNSSANLSITGSSGGGTLAYQWQITTDTTAGFTDITGATSDTYSTDPLTSDTTYFRVVVGNGACDADTSEIITVTTGICPVLTINSSHSGQLTQYSDTVRVRAHLALSDGTPLPNALIKFRIYNGKEQDYGSNTDDSAEVYTDEKGFADTVISLTQDPTNGDPFEGKDSTGIAHIRAYFEGGDLEGINYLPAEKIGPFNVRKENARYTNLGSELEADKISFNNMPGSGYIVTTNSSEKVTFKVKLEEVPDGLPGDINKAIVKFVLNPAGSADEIVQIDNNLVDGVA
ncbi:MAG: hypothetical protein ACKO6K_00135, partial [Chitinophagaceae bacterium]